MLRQWEFFAGMTFLTSALAATWSALREGAPFLLVGFAVAGLLHEFLDTRRIVRAMGTSSLRSVFAATLLGTPLPLCSCGVLPAAVSLKRKGASREATLAFLITTPETGIDTIALTYGLFGLVFAVLRPVLAVITGLVAGGLSLMPRRDSVAPPEDEPEAKGEAPAPAARSEGDEPKRVELVKRFERAMRFGLLDLMADLAFWLALGFAATGLVTAALPDGFFERFLGNEALSILVMALVGAGTYVCASASTPVAAAMMAKGLNPGAALVFLLTGPATNPATIGIVARFFGRRFLKVYLSAVFGVAILGGLAVNAAVRAGVFAPRLALGSAPPTTETYLKSMAAVVFICFLGVAGVLRGGFRKGAAEFRDQLRAAGRAGRRLPWRPILRIARVALPGPAVLLWLSTAILVVRPGERGLVRTFGKVTASDLEPGLHLALPRPFARAETVAVDPIRTVELGFRADPLQAERGAPSPPGSYPDVTPSFTTERYPRIPWESQFVTGDENVIDVTAVVQYRVADPARFRFGIDRSEPIVRATSRAFLVEEIGRVPVDEIYASARGRVEEATLQRLRETLRRDASGIEPLCVRLLYVHAPDDVHQAFRDVASSVEDRSTSRNKALTDAVGSVAQARGEAERSRLEAEGIRDSVVMKARGSAAAFVPFASEYATAPAATRLRLYLETVERVLAPLTKWIKPGAKESPGLELWIARPSAGPSPAPGRENPPPTQLIIPDQFLVPKKN